MSVGDASSGSVGAETSSRRGQDAPRLRPTAYRPLSSLALLSFGLASVSAILILAAGIFSFATHAPLLLPLWTVVIPLATCALCLGARRRVHGSEGTLAGESLASTGFIVTVIISVIYAVYYGATRFSVIKE